MPFGLIFGSVFYGLLCLWLGVRFLMSSWLPLRVMGALLVALGVSMSLGLLLRQSWARWVGVAVAVLLPGWLVISMPETVLVYVIFLAGLTTALLLVIPATGNVHRGLPEGATPRRRAGTVLGPTVAATLLGFLAVLVWAWNAPAPPSRSSRQASSIWTPGGPVSWSEFGPGLELAKREDKPVFVDFYASWCEPCWRMDRVTFRDPEVVRLLDEVVTVRVDSEATEERHGYVGFELAERYRVMTYPTVALLDADGQMIARRSGFQGPGQFRRWLKEALELARQGRDGRLAGAGVEASKS